MIPSELSSYMTKTKPAHLSLSISAPKVKAPAFKIEQPLSFVYTTPKPVVTITAAPVAIASSSYTGGEDHYHHHVSTPNQFSIPSNITQIIRHNALISIISFSIYRKIRGLLLIFQLNIVPNAARKCN